MNEYAKKKLTVAAGIVAVLVCIGLVIFGHNYGFSGDLSKGIGGLGIEILGLAGILVLLYLYNKPFTK